MPIEISLNTFKRTIESTDGNAQLTIPDGGAAQYSLTHTAGSTGQVLTCGATPSSLEWSDKVPSGGTAASMLMGDSSYLKNKFDGTFAPGTTDDAGAGYAVGSTWVDATNGEFYICVDASVGSAIWNSGLKKAYARMRRTTGGSVNTNTLRPITNWTSTDFQENITCNQTTGLFTIQSAGVYKLFFHLAADGSNNNHGVFAVINGVMNTDHLICASDYDSSTDNLFAPSGEIFLSLSANDTVGIWFGNPSTGASISDSIVIMDNTTYANIVKL